MGGRIPHDVSRSHRAFLRRPEAYVESERPTDQTLAEDQRA